MIAGFPIAGRPIAGSRFFESELFGTAIASEMAASPAIAANLTVSVRLGVGMRARPRLLATLTGVVPRTRQEEDPAFIRANQDEPLDALVWRATGLAAGAVERVIEANRGIADLGTHLPEGHPVFIPPLAAVRPATLALVNLWD